MKNSFQTITSSKQRVRVILITWIVEALLAFLGLFITLAAFIFFEILLSVVNLLMLLVVSKVNCLMRFEGTLLICTNTVTKQQLCFDTLKHCDLMFMQKESQKAKNCGNLKIIGTSLTFYDVQNFEELKAYVDENFSN